MSRAPKADTSRLIDATGVGKLFGRGPEWFRRDRVRKRLYEKGFPLPAERGLWLRTAVEAYQERVGNQTAYMASEPSARSAPADRRGKVYP